MGEVELAMDNMQPTIDVLLANASHLNQMADYIELSYRASPQDGASLLAQGREYIVDSVVTTVTCTAHLHDNLETVLQGQKASIDAVAAELEAASIRAAAVKTGDGLAHLREQQGSVPAFNVRAPTAAGEDPPTFVSIPVAEMAPHLRTTYEAVQHRWTGGIGGRRVDALREGICYSLSSLDDVGHCMASESDRDEEAASRLAKHGRRPTLASAAAVDASLHTSPPRPHATALSSATLHSASCPPVPRPPGAAVAGLVGNAGAQAASLATGNVPAAPIADAVPAASGTSARSLLASVCCVAHTFCAQDHTYTPGAKPAALPCRRQHRGPRQQSRLLPSSHLHQ